MAGSRELQRLTIDVSDQKQSERESKEMISKKIAQPGSTTHHGAQEGKEGPNTRYAIHSAIQPLLACRSNHG